MKVLIIGSGGREHALAWKIKQSKKVDQIMIAPGNAGTAQIGQNVNIAAEDINSLLKFALKEKIDLTVVGPENPLALGIVDLFTKHNLVIFGPSQKASQIEASKVFAKRFMKKFNIPTADFRVFASWQKAKQYLNRCSLPKVIKADGLAAGKGVFVCRTKKDGKQVLQKIMVEKIFGKAGNQVVIEDCLKGQEASVICFTDGRTILPLLPAQDHKPVYDRNLGPNTGGMGAYAPTPLINKQMLQKIINNILKPTVLGMKKICISYKGILYAGLMLTKAGPKVLEFNCRLGDPETQPQLMLLKTDLVNLMLACIRGKLKHNKLSWHPGFSVCVILASGGYPGNYKKGEIIYGLDKIHNQNIQIFQAGTVKQKRRILTNGGRVLGVTGYGKTINQALDKTYSVIGKQGIYFNQMHYRKDIGAKYSINNDIIR